MPTQSNSLGDEDDNTPIAASLLVGKKAKSVAQQKRKEKRQLWAYEPAADRSASKYWDVGVEGKRTQTVRKASYREDDARSDSEQFNNVFSLLGNSKMAHGAPFILHIFEEY